MESLKSEVKQLIAKLADRYNNLPEGPLHPLDADLMLAMLRQLYEKTEALRNQPTLEVVVEAEPEQYSQPSDKQDVSPVELHEKLADPEPSFVPPIIAFPEPPFVSPVIASPESSFVPPASTPPPPPVEPEIIPAEPHFFSMNQPFGTHPPVPTEFKAENEFSRDSGTIPSQPHHGPFDLFGAPTIADKLKSEVPSLKDKITFGKHDQTLADRMQLKPISDLKTAIGLNDKFQFINDLFEGSADRYNEAMSLLNTCSSGSEADQLFADLHSRYNWDNQNIVFMKLKEFITRRYL